MTIFDWHPWNPPPGDRTTEPFYVEPRVDIRRRNGRVETNLLPEEVFWGRDEEEMPSDVVAWRWSDIVMWDAGPLAAFRDRLEPKS